MAKKSSAGKSTAHHQKGHRRQQSGKSASGKLPTHDENRNAGSGPTRPEDEPVQQGIPEEHYYGERASRTPGNSPDVAGSLNEETVDKDAPYNRTYGRGEAEGR